MQLFFRPFKLLCFCLLFGSSGAFALAQAKTECTNASVLWDIAEGREQPIVAKAECGGKYFQTTSKLGNDIIQEFGQNIQYLSNQNRQFTPPSCQLETQVYGPILSESAHPVFHFDALNNVNLNDNQLTASEKPLEPITVEVPSVESKYIGETENPSVAIAQAETTEKLANACARAVMDEKKKTDPLFAAQHSILDIAKQIQIATPKAKSSGSVDVKGLGFGYSYTKNIYSPQQKQAVIQLLNEANSCSTFEITDTKGITRLSNCDQTMGGKLQHYQKQELARIALAVALGAAGNYFRGGEMLNTGNDQITRFFNSLVTASIRPIVQGVADDPKQFVWDAVRADFAQTVYTTHDYVAGARNDRSLATTIKGGALSNALFFGLTCGDAHCSLLGIPMGLIYSGFGAAADNHYNIFGKPANAYSEAVLGGFLGLALGLKYSSEREHQLSNNLLTLDLARISAQDLCLDASSILK